MTKDQITYLRTLYKDNIVVFGDNAILAQNGFNAKASHIIWNDSKELYHSIKLNCSTDNKFSKANPITVNTSTYDDIQYISSSMDIKSFETFLNNQVSAGCITSAKKEELLDEFRLAIK